VLTIFWAHYLLDRASYIFKKYSDFRHFENKKFFRFWRVWKHACYNRDMLEGDFNKILKNSESAWDEEFSFEHQNLAMKIFSDMCCNGCTCKSESDHTKTTDNGHSFS
jgi:hypothetical protein